MKTSYFGNLRNIKVPLSISQYPPEWYDGPELKMLAPPRDLLKAAHNGLSHEDYTRIYKEQVLSKIDPRELYDAIIEEYGDEVMLLCFEKPGDFCHRRLVAEWFQENLNIEVAEWIKPSKIRSTLSF